MLDFSGGTSLLNDVFFMATFNLKRSFYRGRLRVMQRDASFQLQQSAPEGRLKMDGINYYG
jgi:hypothetical protein